MKALSNIAHRTSSKYETAVKCRSGLQHRHVLGERGQAGPQGGGGGRQPPEPCLHRQVSTPQQRPGQRQASQQCCQVS